jgi:hypothetical protein
LGWFNLSTGDHIYKKALFTAGKDKITLRASYKVHVIQEFMVHARCTVNGGGWAGRINELPFGFGEILIIRVIATGTPIRMEDKKGGGNLKF